jgi:hypothetical protein
MRNVNNHEVANLKAKAEIYEALYNDQPIAKFNAYEDAGVERLLKAVLAHNEEPTDETH